MTNSSDDSPRSMPPPGIAQEILADIRQSFETMPSATVTEPTTPTRVLETTSPHIAPPTGKGGGNFR